MRINRLKCLQSREQGAAMLADVMLLLLLLLSPSPSLVDSVPPPGPAPAACRRCCDHMEPAEGSGAHEAPAMAGLGQMPEVRTFINMTILRGDKGDRGARGTPGKGGEEGSTGPAGPKGADGRAGPPGDDAACSKTSSTTLQRSAFSVGRRKSLHSLEHYRPLLFDTVFVDLPRGGGGGGHFDMFTGLFRCGPAPGVYFFNVNVHTWNLKETYLHVMHNERERAVLYAQPGERSVMQSQSLMLALAPGDQVWVRLYRRERETAVYSDEVDVYITFNGYLVTPTAD